MNQHYVYIVDDNKEFSDSTSWVLEGAGYTVVKFNDPYEALHNLENEVNRSNSCCLLDIRMPNMSGLEFHENLLSKNILIPIIYMTGHGDIPLAVEAMSKGAVTFLEKPLDFDMLNTALDCAFSTNCDESDITISQDVEYQSRLSNLTKRESEILNEIVAGKMNKVIALDLGISVKTVELHRSRVMTKMHATTAAELVKMVITKSIN
ncbi:MAG: response regulator [Candidatus Thiodiazotropha sp. 6PLUC2]